MQLLVGADGGARGTMNSDTRMRKDFLRLRVNFILSVILIGSVALLGIVVMLKAAELENPIAEHLSAVAQELEM